MNNVCLCAVNVVNGVTVVNGVNSVNIINMLLVLWFNKKLKQKIS